MLLNQITPGETAGTSLTCHEDRIDLVHWWASRGETAAMGVLRQALADSGVSCVETPISGGASMASQLESRLIVGDIPTATVVSGFGSRRWADLGVLADLTALAASEGWEKAIPQELQEFCCNHGKWFGVPATIHSINWLWINRKVERKLGLAGAPESLDELFDALERALDAGIVPLAIGEQAWLVATVLDSLVVAVNGYDFYRSALGELDPTALRSGAMVDAFRALARLGAFTLDSSTPRNWTDATRLVATGEALLEISGDWVRAEFEALGARPDVDYSCVRFPGTENGVIFNADIIAMFDVASARRAAQATLARTVMDPAVQTAFSIAKGAAPARIDVQKSGLTRPAMDALTDIRQAEPAGTLVGSMAHGYMQPIDLQTAYSDIALQVFRGDMTPEQGASALAERLALTPATADCLSTFSKDTPNVDL